MQSVRLESAAPPPPHEHIFAGAQRALRCSAGFAAQSCLLGRRPSPPPHLLSLAQAVVSNTYRPSVPPGELGGSDEYYSYSSGGEVEDDDDDHAGVVGCRCGTSRIPMVP